MQLEKIVEQIEPLIVAFRRSLHVIPEPSYEEEKTCQFILNTLKDIGIEGRRVARTGVIADINFQRKGLNVAIRADMDALPVKEKTELDFASEHDGYMHACGHDGHMAILLGLAMLFYKAKESFSGRVRLIFQPAEEKPPKGGAKYMIEEGCLEGIDRIIGYHIMPDFEWDKISIKEGPVMAAADEFEIQVKGSGGHASAPEKTNDTILIAAKIVQELVHVVPRFVSPLDAAVVTCGEIHGGNSFNVIPEIVTIKGTVRTFKKNVGDKIEHRIKEVIKGFRLLYRTNIEIDYKKCYPPVINDESSARFLKDVAETVYGREKVLSLKPLMGSEDFSEYLQIIRGCYIFFGGKEGKTFPLHSPYYNFSEKVLSKAVLYLGKVVQNSSLWE